MSIDPTPPSDQLPAGSTEGVRAGTKSKFNMVALVGGLALILVGFVIVYMLGFGPGEKADAALQSTPAEAAEFSTDIEPAKGDSPVGGDAVDAMNVRKDGPSDPTPATAP